MSPKALVVPYRYLGDTLLAVPLARSLRQAGYQVDWLVHDGSQGILDKQSFVTDVYVLNHENTMTVARKLWRNYDLACVVNGTDRLTALARLAARRVLVTLTQDRFADAWKRLLSSAWQPFTADTHTLTYINGLAALAGVEENWHAGLDWSEEDECSALQQASVKAGGYVHVHPFARVAYKYWPDIHWQALAQRAVDAGYQVVVTGSPADQQHAEAVFSSLGDAVHLCCGRLHWRQLSALSARAAVYVGVDTANTHLAAGSGAQVVALFGPTNPCLWAPWPQGKACAQAWQRKVNNGIQKQGNITLLQGIAMDCIPCQGEGCEDMAGRSRCLENMDVDRVWSACLERIHG